MDSPTGFACPAQGVTRSPGQFVPFRFSFIDEKQELKYTFVAPGLIIPKGLTGLDKKYIIESFDGIAQTQ